MSVKLGLFFPSGEQHAIEFKGLEEGDLLIPDEVNYKVGRSV